ncbi:hypothetical protein BKH43_07590 [Helicobacter sp. 13S00401-1]|uniref:hypothetical protein n=1 Tax=Helicobacter sp. 13S00401-1 TaxID=1905758 RepID=UPI000BA7A06F|nr:hypothetical protein [Helicobacter sp. 13S00401-1]PAF48998.1 hypothetical protein BKH43_07590 [Helicobacter sp. 13S00401-1]
MQEHNIIGSLKKDRDEVKREVLASIESKKALMSFELLGRSLAYNTFPPRLSYQESVEEVFKDGVKVALLGEEFLEEFFKNAEVSSVDAFKNLTRQDRFESLIIDSLDCIDYIGMFRRLSPYFLIAGGINLDPYQVLEATIAGSDGILFDLSYIDSKKLLNDLVAFSLSLGLMPVLKIDSKKDLKLLLGLKNPVDCLYVPSSLVSLVPKRYIIFSEDYLKADAFIEVF